MDDYHYMGMEHFDGGNERWDFDNDGKLDLLERNARMSYDNMILDEMEEEESDSLEDDEDEDEDPDDFDEDDEFSDEDDGFGEGDDF